MIEAVTPIDESLIVSLRPVSVLFVLSIVRVTFVIDESSANVLLSLFQLPNSNNKVPCPMDAFSAVKLFANTSV